MKAVIVLCLCVVASSASANPPSYRFNGQQYYPSEYSTPVGVPVAPLSPYWYSYSAYQPRNQSAENKLLAKQIAQEVLSQLIDQAGTNKLAARAPEPTMVALKCVKCHGGPEPKGGLSLESLESLTAEQKLKCMNMVLTEKMPLPGKTKKLTPDEVGKLFIEFTGDSAVAARAPLPPGPPEQER